VPDLVLGPLLRYVGEHEATVWVETDEACEVEILGRRERTWRVGTHHYALVTIDGLQSGSSTLPHHHPYSMSKDGDPQGREVDAVHALALRMRAEPQGRWPHVLLMLGEQVYADETSPGAHGFIRGRRDTSVDPGLQVADFEEYTRLYYDAWQDPAIRWLLSTVSSAMIFDDHDVHDVHDDWNTSAAWVAEYRAKPWWDRRIVGAFTSYWIYSTSATCRRDSSRKTTSIDECAGPTTPSRCSTTSPAAPTARPTARSGATAATSGARGSW
jgi:hypothetical protein